MLLATWNVNSVRARLEILSTWLGEHRPEVVLLQETKTLDATFPLEPLEDLGYNIATWGQKSYNGVAILSKFPFDDVRPGLPTLDARQHPLAQEARYLEADIQGVTFASVYVPNGRSATDPMYVHKLSFLDALGDHISSYNERDIPLVVGGDYNVALDDHDVSAPEAYQNHILFTLPERAAMGRLFNLGVQDVLATFTPAPLQPEDKRPFTWWDYRKGSWEHNKGARIDYLLATPGLMDRGQRAWVDAQVRGVSPASDHAPLLWEILCT